VYINFTQCDEVKSDAVLLLNQATSVPLILTPYLYMSQDTTRAFSASLQPASFFFSFLSVYVIVLLFFALSA
jgi:hypothetical protein